MGSRREILKSMLMLPVLGSGVKLYSKTLESALPSALPEGIANLIFPKALVKGSKVAFTASASPSSKASVSAAANYFKKYGCEIIYGETVLQSNRGNSYLSAPDDVRANELMEFFKREDIDAIIEARGGYGVMRILDKLDYEVIKNNPKILMGFSDITALLLAVYKKSSLVCFHGPVASSSYGKLTADSLTNQLFKDSLSLPQNVSFKKTDIIISGLASGYLTGGNLSIITATLGTDYEIDTRNSILFIEETKEEPYKIDRMLTQLHLAGKLKDANGIVFGNMEYLHSRRNFFPGRSMSTMQILQDRFELSEKPVVIGLPFGHTREKITLPLGAMAELDTEKQLFSITGKSVLV